LSAHAAGAHAGRTHAAGSAITEVLLAESCESLLLRNGVDVGADDEADQIEEGNPQVLGEELLGEGEADGRDDPGDLHDLPEAHADGGADLVECAGASDEGHGDEIDHILDRCDLGALLVLRNRKVAESAGTYNQIAGQNLQNLSFQACAAREGLLQEPDQDVAHGRAHKSTVSSHLGNTRGEVVAVLIAILGEERSDELLSTGQSTGCEHLCSQRVVFELLEVGLSSLLDIDKRCHPICGDPSGRT
jgi:hypothetical protein